MTTADEQKRKLRDQWSGKDQQLRRVQRRVGPALQQAHLQRQRLQPAQRAQRFGQAVQALAQALGQRRVTPRADGSDQGRQVGGQSGVSVSSSAGLRQRCQSGSPYLKKNHRVRIPRATAA